MIGVEQEIKSESCTHTPKVITLGDPIKLKGSPIQRRQARIKAFKELIASNRKQKSVRELIALYALESGLRKKVVEEYLKLLLDSGTYKRCHRGRGHVLLVLSSENREEIETNTQWHERRIELEKCTKYIFQISNVFTCNVGIIQKKLKALSKTTFWRAYCQIDCFRSGSLKRKISQWKGKSEIRYTDTCMSTVSKIRS